MNITMSAKRRIGWGCWSVFASVSGITPRMLAQRLPKLRAKRFVERVKRLLNSQVTNRVPDGCRLSMVPGPGAGHGHWRLVWDVQTEESSALFVDDLPKQTARKDRDELNAVLDAVYELKFSAVVLDRLKTELTDNAALISKGTGPAVQGLLKVNDELKKQTLQLQYGPSI